MSRESLSVPPEKEQVRLSEPIQDVENQLTLREVATHAEHFGRSVVPMTKANIGHDVCEDQEGMRVRLTEANEAPRFPGFASWQLLLVFEGFQHMKCWSSPVFTWTQCVC